MFIVKKAIDILKDKEMMRMGLRYSRLEKKLGEVDRARAIYTHLSQFSDPQDDVYGLWKVDFEL
jgi:pre-mRNA-splicing factor SYF1